MISETQSQLEYEPRQVTVKNLPRWLLRPLPLIILQPILQRLIRRLSQERSDLFERLGAQRNKVYLIDPLNLPFVFLLCPDPARPKLSAYRRGRLPRHDARIAATFLTLVDMIDSRLDGDALFFNRELLIEGDVEAVVVLRNALDDLDGSIVDNLADHFGPPTRAALSALRHIRSTRCGKK